MKALTLTQPWATLVVLRTRVGSQYYFRVVPLATLSHLTAAHETPLW